MNPVVIFFMCLFAAIIIGVIAEQWRKAKEADAKARSDEAKARKAEAEVELAKINENKTQPSD